MKWNKISKKNLNVILEILDEVFITPGVNFSSIIINKDIIDFEKEFNHDPYKAYQDFSERLLCKNIKYNEVLIVLADYISTPNHIHYEVDLKHSINSKFNRLSVGGIHRIDSRSVNLIQVVDLLIGSVIYEYKISSKLVNGDKFKLKVSKYILNRLNTKSFIGGTESKNFRVFEQV